jgi:hypothetical protein
MMPNRPTYGDLAFHSSRVPPNSTYRIAQWTTGYRRICMVRGIQKSWTMAPLMLS